MLEYMYITWLNLTQYRYILINTYIVFFSREHESAPSGTVRPHGC